MATNSPVTLTEDNAGGWIKGEIWAIAAGSQPIGFIECLRG